MEAVSRTDYLLRWGDRAQRVDVQIVPNMYVRPWTRMIPPYSILPGSQTNQGPPGMRLGQVHRIA